ncbi:MAG: hypothetical protein AAGF93_19780 [Cyanobacteria bacterium P01_H01_bin.105]
MTRYAVLFEVDIWHDYSLNRGGIIHEALSSLQQAQVMGQYASNRFLKIQPTAITIRTLAGQQLLFRPTQTGFLVAVKLDPASSNAQPLIPLANDFELTFALQVVDPYFFNYTALSDEALPFYWLSNESGNEIAGERFLSRPVSPFDSSRAYLADELYSEPAAEGSINLFRARQDTGPTVPSDIPISNHWELIPADTFDASLTYLEGAIVLANNQLYRALQAVTAGSDLNNAALWEPFAIVANQYVTSADSLAVRPILFNLDLSDVALTQATVRIISGATTVAWERTFESTNGPLETVQVTLSTLQSGRYRLELLDAALIPQPTLGFEFYLDATAVRDRWFGVINISLGSGDFALLDGSNNLRSPRYRLRFLNRASRWRYRFPADQAVGTGADVAPEVPENQQVLVTAEPRPLTRYGPGIRLQADDTDTSEASEEVLLPEPDIRRIQRQNAQWYSDIYLSNLPVELPSPST